MAVEPLAPLDVTVTGSVTISILGPIGIGVLVVAIALLASGIWVTARAAARDASPPPALRDRPLQLIFSAASSSRSARALRASSAITAIVAPTTMAPPRIAPRVSDSPSRIHASTTVMTGDTCVISAESHDATCLCDQITSV